MAVAGWIKHPFALDFRVYHDRREKVGGWHITHLASGYSAGTFTTGLRRAQELADGLADAADWSFSGTSISDEVKLAVAKFRDGNRDYRNLTIAFHPLTGAEA